MYQSTLKRSWGGGRPPRMSFQQNGQLLTYRYLENTHMENIKIPTLIQVTSTHMKLGDSEEQVFPPPLPGVLTEKMDNL